MAEDLFYVVILFHFPRNIAADNAATPAERCTTVPPA